MRHSDAYFSLIAETLDGLESSARAQFLQRFFLTLAHVEISESLSLQLWDDAQSRRAFLSERTESEISLQTALLDVLISSDLLRVPIILEYDELKSLQRTAVTDPLTGLQNRRLFDESFDKELNRARRYNQPLSLVMLDLHRFKEVNDKYGHPRGDEVLRAAAATLKKALRTSDSAFRIGGDEFALLLPQTDSTQASALSRRVGIVFAEILRPLQLEVPVAMDHGVSTYPQDGDQRIQLIRISDDRLYQSKHENHRKSEGGAESVSDEKTSSPAVAAVAEPVQPESQKIVADSSATAAPTSSASSQPVASSPSVPESVGDRPTTSAPPVATEQPPAPAPMAAPPSPPSSPSFPVAASGPHLYAVPRKAERVSMVGTNAFAVLGEGSTSRARVVDLGFGGVALDFPASEGISETLFAVLHVPILPPVRVNLKRVWTRQISQDTIRVGCCFIS